MDSHVTLRINRRWLRLALVVLVTAAVVAPVAVYASHQFTDVDDSNIFHDDIAWMADNGITYGCNPPANDEFCPKDPVTREQLAAFMHRFADNQPTGIAGYETHFTLGASDSTDSKTVEATCPVGKVILGGGANITPEGGTPPPIAITRSFGFIAAAGSVPTWRVTAQEITAYGGNWSVIPVIHCADPLP